MERHFNDHCYDKPREEAWLLFLATTVLVFLDRLIRLAVINPKRFQKHFPDVGILLRMLKPGI